MGGAIYNAKGMGEPTYGLLLSLIARPGVRGFFSASAGFKWERAS